MKTSRPTPSKMPASVVYWLSFIGLLGLFGLIAVPDAVMCDGDTSCIEYKQGGLLDGTVRKMAPAEVLQFWQEVDQATPAVSGAPASQLDATGPMRSEPTLRSQGDAHCPPLDLRFLTLRIRTTSPSPLCLWMT
jgi:hypothetical protein